MLPAVEHVELAVETFRMLADVTRLQVLWALLDGELSVNELAEVVGSRRRRSPSTSRNCAWPAW